MNVAFTMLNIFALLILIILVIIFFTKKRLHNIEDSIYGLLLIISIFTITSGILLGLSLNSNITYKKLFIIILNKLYLIELFTTLSIFAFYTYIISRFFKPKKKTQNIVYCTIFLIVNIMIIMFLPLTTYSANIGLMTKGLAMDYTSLLFMMIYIFLIVLCVLDIKKLNNKKYIPIIMLIIGGIAITVLQFYIENSKFIINPAIVINCLIMYFTIENPDMKVVNELLRNRELVQKANEDKARFLFEVSEEIKLPANNIIKLAKLYDKLKEEEDKKEAIKKIENNANNILFSLNDVLNIPKADASKIKIEEERYDTRLLFNNIKYIAKNKIGSKDIELRFTVSNNIPRYLYGDDIRLKQIIMSVLINSIQGTSSGYISVKIDAIVKYDVTRLVIEIEDTGRGISIQKINTILDDYRELTREQIDKLDEMDMDLIATIRVIKLLGGSFNIKSDEKIGTTSTIVIDQKCDKDSVLDYSNNVVGKKRILLVNNNKEELDTLSNTISKYNVDLNITTMGMDCINKIEYGEKYDFIIIDDELKDISAYEVLKKLNQNKKFKVPVIVLLEKDKARYKNSYIEQGFKDCIIKDNINENTDKVLSKYL